jgi:ketose-bisphosphate aldolase
MTKTSVAQLMQNALRAAVVIPGFNIPYLPMMAPVVRALRDTNTFGLVMVARLEWTKFQSGGLRPIRDEYERVKDESVTRLHLDHVPVIDEDNRRVDFEADLATAIELGYDSIMIDGSRLPLQENIACTRRVVEMAHARVVPVEAELGAVMGHEAGPLPPYEELFATGQGFTDPVEARQFVRETGVDWLSVAVGSVHGAISAAARVQKKVEARLSIDHLDRIRQAVNVPLVLHGGTGIQKPYIMDAIRHGIAKINIATAIRQPYEAAVGESVAHGQKAVYQTMLKIIRDELEIEGSAETINPRS